MKSYPPFLDEIHLHCPKAAFLYTKFWRDRDDSNVSSYKKETITEEEGISWKTFICNIRFLKKERVITFKFNRERDFVKIHLLEKKEKHIENAA